MRKEGFFVLFYNPSEQSLWHTTGRQMHETLKEKREADKDATIEILKASERVYYGDDPDDILKSIVFNNATGGNPEALLKAYE